MPKKSNRDKLVAAGVDVMFKLGYSGAGVRDITSAAEAPLGSFTNHFRSKEVFASEVLDRYFAYVKGLMEESLHNRSLGPVDRIKRYLDIVTSKLEAREWTLGCLIGNFSLEAPDHSELLRDQLSRIFKEWREPFAECIAEAQAAQEIHSDFTAEELAEVLLSGWHGAMLRMKVDQSPLPLERFKKIAFSTFLGKGC